MTLITMGVANKEQGIAMLHHPADDGLPISFPSHRDSMSLDSIRPKDVPHGGTVAFTKEDVQALRTHDIQGAAPAFMSRTLFLGGPPVKEPMPWSQAATRYPVVRREVDLSLRTHDIDLAQPRAKHFQSARDVNPLTPRYDLPSFREKPPTPPTARMHEGRVWDSMEFVGKHTPRILEREYARNPLETRDIEYSQSNFRTRTTFTPRDTMRTIERAGERILSTKCHTPRGVVHPLEPVYKVDVKTTHPFRTGEGDTPLAPAQAGRVPGSTSRVLHRDNGEPQTSLIRSDLPGAMPQRYKGAMPYNIYDSPEVTPYAKYTGLDCKDIEGTQTGTRKY